MGPFAAIVISQVPCVLALILPDSVIGTIEQLMNEAK